MKSWHRKLGWAVFVFSVALLTPSAAFAQQIEITGAWGGGGGQPPCPAVASDFYRPDALPSENISIAGNDWWCEPGEAVIGYAIRFPTAGYVRQEKPDCPDGWQPQYVDSAARALRAASAHFASMGTPQGQVLNMAAGWLAPLVERAAPGSVRAIVEGITGDYSTCSMLGIAVPEGKQITRVQTTLVAPGATMTSIGSCGLFRTTETAPPNHGCAASPSTPDAAGRIAFEDYRIIEGSVAVTVKDWSGIGGIAYLRVYYLP